MFDLKEIHLKYISDSIKNFGEIYFHGNGDIFVCNDKNHENRSNLKQNEAMAGDSASFRVKLSVCPKNLQELTNLLLSSKTYNKEVKKEEKKFVVKKTEPVKNELDKNLKTEK